MTMALKYQISLCLRPSDILLVTFNHLDAIRAFVEDSVPIRNQVEAVFRMAIKVHYNTFKNIIYLFFIFIYLFAPNFKF